MFIGRSGSGKTSLIQRLNNEDLVYKKTQSLVFYKNFLDTPGEYLENRRFYNALLVSSYEYDAIIIIQSATDNISMFSPSMNSMFNKEVIGVVTKIDLPSANIKFASEVLKYAGSDCIFLVSSVTCEGIDKLYRRILNE